MPDVMASKKFLKRKTSNFRLPSVAPKRLYLSSLFSPFSRLLPHTVNSKALLLAFNTLTPEHALRNTTEQHWVLFHDVRDVKLNVLRP